DSPLLRLWNLTSEKYSPCLRYSKYRVPVLHVTNLLTSFNSILIKPLSLISFSLQVLPIEQLPSLFHLLLSCTLHFPSHILHRLAPYLSHQALPLFVFLFSQGNLQIHFFHFHRSV